MAIFGAGPLGLATALKITEKQTSWRIAVIDSFTIGNTNGSSGSAEVRQFQQANEEWYLSDLGRIAIPLWADLERRANLTNGSLLNTQNGYLYINSYAGTNRIYNNCRNLSLPCVLLNPTELKYNYSFIDASSDQQGVFMPSSGLINVTLLIEVLKTLLKAKPNVIIRENEVYLAHDATDKDVISIYTSRGSLRATKVVFVPGPYAKNVSALLGLNLNMSLWELPTFYARRLLNTPEITPAWFADSFAGYAPESNSSLYSDYVRIEPHFLTDSHRAFSWPNQRTNQPDPLLLNATHLWLKTHMSGFVDSNDILAAPKTCLASVLPDGGYLLDYVPGDYNRQRLIMAAGGWAMKYIPVFADILTDFVLDETATSPYASYLDQFSFNRPGRLISEETTSTMGPTTLTSTRQSENSNEKLYLIFMIVVLIAFIAVCISFLVYCYMFRRRRGYQG